MRPMRSPSGFSTGSFLIRDANTLMAHSTSRAGVCAGPGRPGNRAQLRELAAIAREA